MNSLIVNETLKLVYESGATTDVLKKLYVNIQANGWDQNKTWMSCVEKLILQVPRNK